MSLSTAITEIIADLRAAHPTTLTVYDTPAEQVNESTVAAVVYAGSGNYRLGAARGVTNPVSWGVHTVFIDLSVPRVDLIHDVPKVLPFVTSVPACLLDGFRTDRFNGSVTNLGDPNIQGGTGGTGSIRYQFIDTGDSGLRRVGYRFEIDVGIEEEAS